MERYDPLAPPEPEEWRAMDESQRIRLAENYHRRAGIRLPNAKAHAIFHVIVENQAALGDEIPVRGTLERLMGEGLDHTPSLRFSPGTCSTLRAANRRGQTRTPHTSPRWGS